EIPHVSRAHAVSAGQRRLYGGDGATVSGHGGDHQRTQPGPRGHAHSPGNALVAAFPHGAGLRPLLDDDARRGRAHAASPRTRPGVRRGERWSLQPPRETPSSGGAGRRPGDGWEAVGIIKALVRRTLLAVTAAERPGA